MNSLQILESKYVSIAMVSHFQIMVVVVGVGVPILDIIGADPATSFFVRSIAIYLDE